MAELIWEGKYRDGKKVAPVRLSLPFQTVETVNESAQDRRRTLDLFARGKQTEWRNRLIWGDKKYVLPSLLPEFAGKVDLIYIDPPFDTGADFSFSTKIPDSETSLEKRPSMIEQKAYRDTWGSGLDSYLQWLHETALLLRELLADDGTLCVHLDENVGSYAKVILTEVFGPKCFLNEVVWHYKRWPTPAREYQKMHDALFLFVKEMGKHKFNKQYGERTAETQRRWKNRRIVAAHDDEGVRVPSDYGGEDSPGAPMDDVWDLSIIAPVAHERTGYPTQKPETLLERLVTGSSDPGDLVLDCFCGSGTTAAVAEKLNRRWIACDLGRFAIHTTRKRLLSLPGVKPFVVQNLGKYERQAWMAAEFEKPSDRAATEARYRAFILHLYGANEWTGAWLHGIKAGRMVHVGAVDAPVTLADVKAIVKDAWKAVGTKGTENSMQAAVDVLGWEFAFELNETAKQLAAESRVDVKFRKIPRDVLDKRAVEQGDVQAKDFFELRALSTKLTKKKLGVTLELTDFVLPAEDLPEDVKRAVKHWSQWIDYWAVDWNYKDDTFHNEWQSYRSRAQSDLELKVSNDYKQAGSYTVVVKVIDILGNDTTKMLTVEVK